MHRVCVLTPRCRPRGHTTKAARTTPARNFLLPSEVYRYGPTTGKCPNGSLPGERCTPPSSSCVREKKPTGSLAQPDPPHHGNGRWPPFLTSTTTTTTTTTTSTVFPPPDSDPRPTPPSSAFRSNWCPSQSPASVKKTGPAIRPCSTTSAPTRARSVSPGLHFSLDLPHRPQSLAHRAYPDVWLFLQPSLLVSLDRQVSCRPL